MAQQVMRMTICHPQLKPSWRGTRATWTGLLQPSAASGEYRVRVDYRLGDSPKVSVLSPPLRRREDGGPIPHVYPGNRPCLYLPRSGEWDPNMFIAETIVPWTALWLLYYEGWLATGEWLGGGQHPDPKLEE